MPKYKVGDLIFWKENNNAGYFYITKITKDRYEYILKNKDEIDYNWSCGIYPIDNPPPYRQQKSISSVNYKIFKVLYA